MTQQRIKYLRDNNDDWYDHDLIEWYEGHKAQKAQTTQIKKALMPIAWHPSRLQHWCVPEDEKKETEKLFLTI